jgi:flagellar motor switch protein FliN/FliY
MKPLLSKEEIADLLAPLEPEAEAKTRATDEPRQSENNVAESLHNQPLQIRVEVGLTRVLLKELLQIRKGSLLNLDPFTGKPLDLYINNHLIARCELVQEVGGPFSIKVTEVTVPPELLNQQENKSTSC